jgi:pimeloyl-ACP methyl ester carboxylesterase
MRTHDGLALHVTTYGPEDASVTVVLAHCWTADEADWHYQVRDLLTHFGHGVRIVTWDHRGHGRSQTCGTADCTIDNLARDMGAVIAHHAPTGPLVLAGHSIGGMTMCALPASRPDLLARVAGLLFVATSSGRLDTVTLGLPEMGTFVRAQIPRVLATRARIISRRSRRGSPRLERQVAQRFLFGRGARSRDIGLVVDQIINCCPETFSGYYADMMTHERTDALAAYDGIPTTVLVGGADLLTPPPHGRRIATNIRGARFAVAPEAGHMLPLERPRLVSDELIALVEMAADTAVRQAATGLR